MNNFIHEALILKNHLQSLKKTELLFYHTVYKQFCMKISEHIKQDFELDLTLSKTSISLENWHNVIESDHVHKAVWETNMKNVDVLMQ